MYSRNHAIVMGLVAIPLAVFAPPEVPRLAVIGYVLALGVGIDVDHFLVARINRGTWDNLRRCVSDPSLVFTRQAEIFDRGDVWSDQRLLSHLLIGGVMVALWWVPSQYLAVVTAITIYTHVLADLFADGQTRGQYVDDGE
jgi:hypothetical protein